MLTGTVVERAPAPGGCSSGDCPFATNIQASPVPAMTVSTDATLSGVLPTIDVGHSGDRASADRSRGPGPVKLTAFARAGSVLIDAKEEVTHLRVGGLPVTAVVWPTVFTVRAAVSTLSCV